MKFAVTNTFTRKDGLLITDIVTSLHIVESYSKDAAEKLTRMYDDKKYIDYNLYSTESKQFGITVNGNPSNCPIVWR